MRLNHIDDSTGDLFAQPIARGRPGAPERREVEWFEGFLKKAGAWKTASEILVEIERPVDESGKRWLKALAAETVWVIGGQKGYLHIEHATAEEINHAANRLESIAKVCSDRARAIRSNGHRLMR